MSLVDRVKAAHRKAMDAVSERILVRRYTGVSNRSRFDAEVRGRVWDYEPNEIAGPIEEGDRRVRVLVEDMIAAQIPLDLREGDKVVVRGKELNIEAADDNTHRVAGVLIAYELQVRG
jgi:hypothetical protein